MDNLEKGKKMPFKVVEGGKGSALEDFKQALDAEKENGDSNEGKTGEIYDTLKALQGNTIADPRASENPEEPQTYRDAKE